MSASGSRRLLLLVIAGVFLLTLTPISGPAETIPIRCLICGSYGTADFILNVLMFSPLGYLVARSVKNVPVSLVAVVATTMAIELLQILVPGRYPTLGDVAANTLGGWLGIWTVHVLAHRSAKVSLRGARTAARATPFALVAVLVLTIAVFRPAFPDSTYYGQWTADLGQFAQYGGQVRSARVSSVDLPGHRLDFAAANAVRSIINGAPLTVEFVAGPLTTELAPVFSVFDEHQVEILVVGARADAIVIRMRRVADALGFHAPEFRFAGGHPPEGTESTFRLTHAAGIVCVRVTGKDLCRAEANPARGWRLFTGISIPAWAEGLLDVVWLALFGFLAVYFASGSLAGSRRWVWRITCFLPTVAYGTMWLLLPGDSGWVPGLVGLIAGSAVAARFH